MGVMMICRVLNVRLAGFYAWLYQPVSARDKTTSGCWRLLATYMP